jgi:hypothetical protein
MHQAPEIAEESLKGPTATLQQACFHQITVDPKLQRMVREKVLWNCVVWRAFTQDEFRYQITIRQHGVSYSH